jgi:glycosyltransferase involved in cell wall biosynthesis
MGVALVVTVRDEASSIFDLLAAIDGQTLAPNEVVIVDGGSSDGTVSELERWARSRPTVTIATAPGASIPAGRNIAISKTTESIVAVTDAGCIPDRDWLYHLVAALDDPAVEVAMGYYRAAPRSRFERLVDCLNLPDAGEVDPEKFMPSSRSVAFRRYVWEQVGGYPEWLPVGEDQWFDHRIVEAGYRRRFVPEAIVRWRLRPDLRSFVRQYYRYAWGDGASGMYPRRHALRFGTYSAAVVSVVVARRHPRLLAAPAIAGLAWLRPSYARAARRLPASERLTALPGIPALTAVMDVAKMVGWLAGRRHRSPSPR